MTMHQEMPIVSWDFSDSPSHTVWQVPQQSTVRPTYTALDTSKARGAQVSCTDRKPRPRTTHCALLNQHILLHLSTGSCTWPHGGSLVTGFWRRLKRHGGRGRWMGPWVWAPSVKMFVLYVNVHWRVPTKGMIKWVDSLALPSKCCMVAHKGVATVAGMEALPRSSVMGSTHQGWLGHCCCWKSILTATEPSAEILETGPSFMTN